MSTFSNLGIRPELLHVLKTHGLNQPTPIQEQAIPIVLVGDDVIAQAQTGTGKTLAFVLPILERIDPENGAVQALIVTPTRELALQITTEVKKMTAALDGVHVLPVYGGQDVDAQMKKLRGGVQVIIATPGRLLDHMRRGTVDLSTVTMLVLDEADQMLHMGFLPEVETIIRETSPQRQTLLFSATMPQQIRSLAQRYMTHPVDIHIQPTRITVEEVKQLVVETTDRNKQETLLKLIEQHRPYLAIIFCRTKRRASALNEALQTHGFESDELHGDLTQAKREKVMKRFREAKIQLLVATDVAARGLDVEGVTHVFNYDIPQDVESYIHRIGRTGRAGEKGLAITLVAPKDKQQLAEIEQGISLSIEKKGGSARQEQGQARGEQRGRSDNRHPRQGGRTANGQPRQGNRQQGGRNDDRQQRQGNRQQGGRNDEWQPRQGNRQQGGRNDDRQQRQGNRQQGGRNDEWQQRQGNRQQGGRNDEWQQRQGNRQQGGRNDDWQQRQGNRQQGGRNDEWQQRQGNRQQGGRNDDWQQRQGNRQQGGRNDDWQQRQGNRQQGGRNDDWQQRQGNRQQGGRNDDWQQRQGKRQQDGRNDDWQQRQGNRQQGGRNDDWQQRQGNRQQGGRNDDWQPRQGDRQQGGRNDDWQQRQGNRQQGGRNDNRQQRPAARHQPGGGRSGQGPKSSRPRFK